MFTAADPSSASPSSHPPLTPHTSHITSLLLVFAPLFLFLFFFLTTSASFSPSCWRVPHPAVTFVARLRGLTQTLPYLQDAPEKVRWKKKKEEEEEEEEERLFSPKGVHSFLGRSPSDAINPGRRLCQGGLNADHRSSPVRRQCRISGQNVQWMLREPDVCERRWDRERAQATVRDTHRERGQVRRQTLGIKCGDWRWIKRDSCLRPSELKSELCWREVSLNEICEKCKISSFFFFFLNVFLLFG